MTRAQRAARERERQRHLRRCSVSAGDVAWLVKQSRRFGKVMAGATAKAVRR